MTKIKDEIVDGKREVVVKYTSIEKIRMKKRVDSHNGVTVESKTRKRKSRKKED